MRKWIVWVVVVAVILGGVVYNEMGKGTPVRVAAAKKGEIRSYVEERARTTLPHVYHITMPLHGRIKPITLTEGDEVVKGKPVAALDEADLQTAVAEAQARLDEVEAEINVSKYNAIEETALKESDGVIQSIAAMVGAAQAKVKGSEARVKYADAWAKAEEALGGDVTSRMSVKKAKTEAAEAAVDYESDQFNLRAMEVIQKISSLLPIYIKQWVGRKTLTRETLQMKKNGAEAALARAKRDLTRAVIVSPVNGVVLKRHVSNERVLSAGDPLLDLGCVDELEVTADVLSEEVVNITCGNPVDIHGAAIGAQPIRGKVARIKPQGFTKVSSLGVEQQRVAVVIAINQEDLQKLKAEKRSLGVEYRVRVRIYTAIHPDAVKVPRTALFRGSGGAWRAFVVRGVKVELCDLTVGLTNDAEAEITGGLSPGDLVVIAPESTLTGGMRVRYDRP